MLCNQPLKYWKQVWKFACHVFKNQSLQLEGEMTSNACQFHFSSAVSLILHQNASKTAVKYKCRSIETQKITRLNSSHKQQNRARKALLSTQQEWKPKQTASYTSPTCGTRISAAFRADSSGKGQQGGVGLGWGAAQRSIPFSRGSGVSSMGLPWDRNWEELCERFCLAFLTDFRENPSTLSTDGGVVAAEDIALLGREDQKGVGYKKCDRLLSISNQHTQTQGSNDEGRICQLKAQYLLRALGKKSTCDSINTVGYSAIQPLLGATSNKVLKVL